MGRACGAAARTVPKAGRPLRGRRALRREARTSDRPRQTAHARSARPERLRAAGQRQKVRFRCRCGVLRPLQRAHRSFRPGAARACTRRRQVPVRTDNRKNTGRFWGRGTSRDLGPQMRLACAQGACARLKAFCRAQDGACVFEQPFSFVCEKKSTADACKKPHAERFFKPSNRHAESGLRHGKPFSCRSERFAFGDRNKVAKLT